MSTATASATTTSIIEHIVLFKVKPETSPSRAAAMVNGLKSLASLDQVLHLAAGPIHHFRSSSSTLTFTHMLHIRFRSKDDLNSYSPHPLHVQVVNDSKPIVDDIMAVDWISDGQPDLDHQSAMRITFFKLKNEAEITNLLSFLRTMKERFPAVNFGENFSPERSNGFSAGSILIFPSANELEAIDSNAEVEEKAAEIIESVMVIDFVINQG